MAIFDKSFPMLAQRRPDAAGTLEVQVKGAPVVVADSDNEGCVTVGLLADYSAERQALVLRYGGGTLMDGAPTIALQLGAVRLVLTWAEAYSIGHALIAKAEEAHYG